MKGKHVHFSVFLLPKFLSAVNQNDKSWDTVIQSGFAHYLTLFQEIINSERTDHNNNQKVIYIQLVRGILILSQQPVAT